MKKIKEEILLKHLDSRFDSMLVLKRFLADLGLDLIKYIDDQSRTQLIEHSIDDASNAIDVLSMEIAELEEELKNG